MSRHPKAMRVLVVVVLVCLAAGFGLSQISVGGPEANSPSTVTNTSAAPNSPSSSENSASTDAQLARLFQEQATDVEVSGSGTVSRILSDDNDGSRHQRFILELDSGQTLLVAHNIDIAPRLDGLQVGDPVSFYGEYVYSDQGGTIHWTHHDPQGQHVAGWLEWKGQRYQ